MSSVELRSPEGALPAAPAAGAWRLQTAAFASTLFLSAFLLFTVQPMFTKMVLPVLGGSPGVWSVAMVFFQGLLLAGYLWAHALTRYLPLRTAALVHLTVTAACLLALPIALPADMGAAPDSGQVIWLLGTFASAVGLPFFALSANGPLLQAWFARTDHPRAANPYTLYGASNIGSFGALLAYPFLIEPVFGLGGQNAFWKFGFALLIPCLMGCALLALRNPAPSPTQSPVLVAAHRTAPAARWTWGAFGWWTVLAAMPSGLLVSVTAHISTDIAAAPLLWVIPLALYLLTFVFAFRDRFFIAPDRLVYVLLFASLLMLIAIGIAGLPLPVSLLVHTGCFFVATLACHRVLYERRPRDADLTVFYVAMSLGGVIGGLFAGLIAPNVFSSVIEYPLLAFAIFACQPALLAAVRKTSWREHAPVLTACAALILIAKLDGFRFLTAKDPAIIAIAASFCFAVLRWRSLPHVLICATALCLSVVWLPVSSKHTQTWRSFFGVHKVREQVHMGGHFRILMHGTTMHGSVRIDENGKPTPAGNPAPTTYYANGGPIAEAIGAARARKGQLQNIFAIGLGVGTLSCQRKPGEAITFFEIDPEVIRIARDPNLFTFMSSCAPDARVILGDARLTVAQQSGQADVIVVDAFSSDAIPVHLLTAEALDVYLNRLAPDGILVFHISNQVMELSKTIARVAATHGLVAWAKTDFAGLALDKNMRAASRAMVLAREPAHAGAIASSSQWRRVEPDMARRPWTDDYSTILQPIIDFHR